MLSKHLLVISSTASAIVKDKTVLNSKFVSGMEKFADGWDGPVSCLIPVYETIEPFSEPYDTAALPFGVTHWMPGTPIAQDQLAKADVVLASGDSSVCLDLVPMVHGIGGKIAYIIENIPETRRRIMLLDGPRSPLRKGRALLWMQQTERRRRRAFARADGLQVNGYPAWDLYAKLNRDPILFLDNRISADLLATADDIDARHRRLLDGAPLQIVHSGRLEPLKGSHELVPIAAGLRDRNIAFELHIFGTGSLEDEMRADIGARRLDGQVHMHGSVDFTSELVPFCRAKGDIFLSCHLQADPSCTYLESFGAGLPVVGYDNRMWTRLQETSQAGWVSPMGNISAMADAIARLDQDRQGICDASSRAHAFAAQNLFDTVFDLRLQHLQRMCA